MKYKAGDEVIISFCLYGHGLEIGQSYLISELNHNSEHYIIQDKGHYWAVRENEIKAWCIGHDTDGFTDKALEMLNEALTQLQYVNNKYPTGTSPAVISRLQTFLQKHDPNYIK